MRRGQYRNAPHRAYANHYERARRQANRAESLDFMRVIKQCGCQIPGCGSTLLPAIDAHHVGPKRFPVFDYLLNHAPTPRNHARVVQELSQCTILCSNCHRALHAAEAAGTPLELCGRRVDVSRLPRAHEPVLRWLLTRGESGVAVLLELASLGAEAPRQREPRQPHRHVAADSAQSGAEVT